MANENPSANANASVASDPTHNMPPLGCPCCGRAIMFDAKLAGQQLLCPDCHSPFLMPQADLSDSLPVVGLSNTSATTGLVLSLLSIFALIIAAFFIQPYSENGREGMQKVETFLVNVEPFLVNTVVDIAALAIGGVFALAAIGFSIHGLNRSANEQLGIGAFIINMVAIFCVVGFLAWRWAVLFG